MGLPETVEEIYEAERENLYSYLLYLGVSPPQAQELTQDAFLKLYLKMKAGEEILNAKAWLYKVAYHLAARHYRREPQFDQLDERLLAPGDQISPETRLIDLERMATLARTVKDLSPQQRNCLYLRGEGLRYREIAEVIGIRTSTVSVFLQRAVARLKESFDA